MNKIFKISLFLFVAIFLNLLLGLARQQFVLAIESLNITINEICWAGTKIEGIESKNYWRYEWLELYNNTEQAISLAGWKIELYRTESWTLELEGIAQPKSYFLIVASDKIFPDYDLNYSNLAGKFNNQGQRIILKDNSNNLIEEIDCLNGWFSGNNQTKQTMEKIDPLASGNNSLNWQTSKNPGGTPRARNSTILTKESIDGFIPEITEKPTYPSGLIINEALPSPEGADSENEWIEIFNQNNFEMNLSGWKISDIVGKTKTYIFPKKTKISAQEFLVLTRPETGIILNNSGDGLKIIQPDEQIVEEITFGKAPLGKSYNRTDSDWLWSTDLTPGAINVIPEPETIEDSSLESLASNQEKTLLNEKSTASFSNQLSESAKSFHALISALALAFSSGLTILLIKKLKNE